MQKFQKQIDRINTRYDYEKDKIVNQIQDEYIIPYCNKHKLQFRSGMGSWVFFKHGTDQIHEPSKRIEELLNLELYSDRTECLIGLEMLNIN